MVFLKVQVQGLGCSVFSVVFGGLGGVGLGLVSSHMCSNYCNCSE